MHRGTRLLRAGEIAPAVDPEQDRVAIARYAACLLATGGVLGCLSTVLPHSPYLDPTGILAVSLLAIAAASIPAVWGSRLPVWSFHVLALAASTMVTAGIYFTHVSPSPNVLLYIWNSLFVFYFFSRRAATLHVLFIASSYAAVLPFLDLLFPPVATWLLTVGTVVVAGFFVNLLKDRLHTTIQQLADAARTDPLTALLNRRGFDERFDQEIERARRSGRPVGLIMCDLDHFKRVNDRLGHAHGDDVLCQLAALLAATKRDIDTAARLGGEEFAIIVPETDARGALVLAERIRQTVATELSDGDRPITISLGVASFPAHADDPAALMTAADRALYRAKRLGRDRCAVRSLESRILTTA